MTTTSPEVPATNPGMILPKFTLGNQRVFWGLPYRAKNEGYECPYPSQETIPGKPLPNRDKMDPPPVFPVLYTRISP